MYVLWKEDQKDPLSIKDMASECPGTERQSQTNLAAETPYPHLSTYFLHTLLDTMYKGLQPIRTLHH